MDAVTVELIRQSMVSIAVEMHETFTRSAHSPVIYEMNDCSVGILDLDGGLLGQSPGLPIFVGGFDHAVNAIRLEYPNPNPGDAFAINDSYVVGSHLNDVTVVTPVFLGNVQVAWAAAKGHWQDIGAKDAGETINSHEIYQEGIRFGAIRVKAAGDWVTDIIRILRANSRTPENLVGDLAAQIAGCQVGERRYRELGDKHGMTALVQARDEIFAHSEAAEVAFLHGIPDGEYVADGAFDNDGLTDDPVPVSVTVRIQGSEMVVDLTGSSKQRRGPTNCGLSQTISAARLALKYLMHDRRAPSGGSFRHLRVIAPPGSVFNAESPAACMMYGVPLGMMLNLIQQALAPVLPKATIAGQPDSACNVIFTGKDSQNLQFITGEATGIGWGARHGADGRSVCIDMMGGDLKNHPIETLEAKWPLLVREYALRTDSGGAGRRRGGLGVVKTYETLSTDVEATLWFERASTPGWGLFGGLDGASHSVEIHNDGDVLHNLKVNHLVLQKGATVTVRTGGGGGFGKPSERSEANICADLEQGYISEDAARKVYRKNSGGDHHEMNEPTVTR